jgi:UDP-hydrolysing UDP-N-acetyl-D-glucosamine 2-epimerase
VKKICVVTTARSEYGVLRWLLQSINNSPKLELQLVVSGGHLSQEQGLTIDFIKKDGLEFTTVDFPINNSSTHEIIATLGRSMSEFSVVLHKLNPDYLLVVGDRYELLSICSAALIMGVPIIHISGGDVTEGAIDDSVRNAITMLATYHFPGTQAAADNIIRMRGGGGNIFTVGEPGIDNFKKEKLMSREEIAESLSIDSSKKWVLMTYHPETKISINENIQTLKNIIKALNGIDNIQIVLTKANIDSGGWEINRVLEHYSHLYRSKYTLISSLGQIRYLSFMKEAWCIIGNSSSGIIEAPFLHTPVINIGDRQKGRYQCKNIRQSDRNYDAITSALKDIDKLSENVDDANYWGDGNASDKIIMVLEQL